MKVVERIFLYTVLVILVFYVFLVDGDVESKEIIQEEIRARSILIVNDAGKEVIVLFADKDGNGAIEIYNKFGNIVAGMGVNEYDSGGISFFNQAGITGINIFVDKYGGGSIGVNNKFGTTAAFMQASEYGGEMGFFNKGGNIVAGMGVNEYGGMMDIFSKFGTTVAWVRAGEHGGGMFVSSKDGNGGVIMGIYENDNGTIGVYNKDGKLIGGLP